MRRGGADGLQIVEGNGAFVLRLRGGDVNVHDDSQVVRQGEVVCRGVVDVDTSGADQVQNVSAVVGGEVDVLDEVEAVKYFHKFSGCFTDFGIDMNIEVTEEQDGW